MAILDFGMKNLPADLTSGAVSGLAAIPDAIASAFLAGVSGGIPNPDGENPDASKDFSAQGVSNLVAGTFQGLPLGGSLGLTGLIMSTGRRPRNLKLRPLQKPRSQLVAAPRRNPRGRRWHSGPRFSETDLSAESEKQDQPDNNEKEA